MKDNKNLIMYLLGGLIVFGFFGLLGLLIYNGVPEQNADLLNVTIGSLLAAFATVVGYFYGSSKSSSDKNEMLKGK
jgi:uncharacterized membrane protein YccC